MALSLNTKLTLNTDGFIRSMNKAQKSLERSGRKMTEVGNQLAVSISAPLLAIGGAALKSFADIEKFKNGLASMMGSTEAAAAEMAKLKKIAQEPGLDLQQAVKGSVRLQSVGIAAEQARSVLAEAGNAIALVGGSSDDLGGVTLAFQQIGAKGKVFAEEINQINERLPQIRQAMKNAFGTANTEEIQKMGISAQDFIAGITVELAKLPRATGGMANSFNNARQAVVQSLATIGESLEKNFNVSARIDAFSRNIQALADRFSNLAPVAQKTILIIAGIAAAIGPLLIGLGSMKLVLATVAGGLSSLVGVITVIATPVGAAVAAIAALTATMVYFYNTNETVRNVLNKIGQVLLNVFIVAFKILKASIAAIIASFQGLFKVMNAIGQMFVAVGKSLLNSLINRFPVLGAVVIQVMGVFRQLSKIVPAVLSGIVAEVQAMVKGITRRFDLLAINVKLLSKSIEKGLTFDGAVKEGLQKEIESLKTQREEIREQGQKFGTAFKDAFQKSMDGDGGLGSFFTIKPSKIPVPPTGGGGGGGGGFTPPALQKETEALNNQADAVLNLANAQGLQAVSFATSLQPIEAVKNSLRQMPEVLAGVESRAKEMANAFALKIPEMANVIKNGMDDMAIASATALGELASNLMDVKSKAQEMSEELGISFEEAKKKVIGNAIGSALIGGFLMPIISVAEQLGKIAIATGIAVSGIKKALASLNPVAAIAAGAGLLALGAFARSRVQNITPTPMAKGGIVLPSNGGTIAQIGEAGQAEAVIPLNRLDSMLSGGGGGFASGEFRLRGRDLYLLIEQEKDLISRSY